MDDSTDVASTAQLIALFFFSLCVFSWVVAAVKEVADPHLTALSEHFTLYLADVNTDAGDWVTDPFAPAVS